jgi:hypothetical protein
MKKTFLLYTSALAICLGGAGAIAQSERAGPAGAAPDAGATERMSPGGGMPAAGARERGAAEGAGPGDAGLGPDSAPRGAANEMKGADTPRGAGKGAAKSDAREEKASRQKSREAQDKAEHDSKRSGDTARSGDAGKSDKKSGDAASDDRSAASGRSEGTDGRGDEPAGSVAKLSAEQRTKMHSSFRSHKSDATVKNIDVDIRVGVVVPRSVSLYAVPDDVVVLVPGYRRYRYFIVDDTVVIVDPATFAIIDVIVLA